MFWLIQASATNKSLTAIQQKTYIFNKARLMASSNLTIEWKEFSALQKKKLLLYSYFFLFSCKKKKKITRFT